MSDTNDQTRILDVAEKLFTTYGPRRVSMDEIASSLRMSKKTIYKHYKSKDDLLLQVTDRFINDLETKVAPVYNDKTLSFDEKFHQLSLLVIDHFVRLGKQYFLEIAQYSAEINNKLEQMKKRSIGRYYQLLKGGIQEGELDPDLNLSLSVLQYAAAIDILLKLASGQHAIPEEALTELPYTPKARIEGLAQLIFKSIKK